VSGPDLSGTVIAGHFNLKSRLGGGHFGDVYRCENTLLGHQSALKVIPLKASSTSTPTLEAKLHNLSTHAHIVKVISATEWQDSAGQDHLLIEMEYVPGGSLEDAIKREIPIGELLSLMKNVLFALDHAHTEIIHRDVKPANILLGGGGKLSDFGIAMVAATGATASNYQYTLNLAPECFPPSKSFTIQTDVFAAGLTLLRALNLITDWRATLIAIPHVLKQMKAGTLISALGFHPRVPRQLQKVARKACAKQSAKRYLSAAAFRDALEALTVLRDWERVGTDRWECSHRGGIEEITIRAKGGGFHVDYWRKGRRKTALHKSGLTQPQAFQYVYELIGATTFA
jgi:eukaryotic-like serine/threonine-protein kinase